MQTILMSGGHLSPLLAMAEEFRRRGDWTVAVAGRRNAFDAARDIESFEYRSISSMGIPFYPVDAPRFPGNAKDYLSYTISFIQAVVQTMKILRAVKPTCFLSFGGYVSVPVGVACRMYAVPIFIHEQTHVLGRANRMLTPWARMVFTSWKKTRRLDMDRYADKSEYTGLPLREDIRSAKTDNGLHQPSGELKKFIGLSETGKKLPVLFVTGGSTGAHQINRLIASSLPDLLNTYRIVHQCGESHFHDYERLSELNDSLTSSLQNRYFLRKFFNAKDTAYLMRTAGILIGRSGANTVAEIAYTGIPSLLLPLAWAADDEQLLNAQFLSNRRAARIIADEDIAPSRFLEVLNEMQGAYASLKKHASSLYSSPDIAVHAMAHRRIADSIERWCRNHRDSHDAV